MEDPVNSGIAALKDKSDTVAEEFDTTTQGKVTHLDRHAKGLMKQYNRQTQDIGETIETTTTKF